MQENIIINSSSHKENIYNSNICHYLISAISLYKDNPTKYIKNGFTLAEILITLGIIGVVSALTLPTLMQNVNAIKYRSQFKKSISTLSQAVRMAQQQYELTFAMLGQTCEDTGANADPNSSTSMCALLNGTLKGATYVGSASEIYGSKDINIGDYPISDYLVYRLSDGSLVGFYKNIMNCSVPAGTLLNKSVLTGSGALKNCLGFIDVNGSNNPNDIVQGTSADSVSWVFGTPMAMADPSFGYGDCVDEGYSYRCYNYYSGEFENIDYSNYMHSDIYDSNGVLLSYFNAQGEKGIGDEYIYNQERFESMAKYNAQGKPGIGYDFKYNHTPEKYGADGSFCGTNYCVDAQGNVYDWEEGTTLNDESTGYGSVLYNIENNPCQQDDNCLSVNASSETADKCSLSSFDPSEVCKVENKSGQISDIFPIVFHDGVVEPASGAAKAVLHQTK